MTIVFRWCQGGSIPVLVDALVGIGEEMIEQKTKEG